jgi:hypothetical protein
MTRSTKLRAVFVLGLTCLALPAMAARSAFVQLENASGTLIEHVQISPVSASEWGEDLLGNAMLPSNNSVLIGPKTEGTCHFDVRVVYRGGTEEVRNDQDLCEQKKLVFTGEAARRPRQSEGEQPAPSAAPRHTDAPRRSDGGMI